MYTIENRHPKYWVTRDGVRLFVCNSTDHLLATMKNIPGSQVKFDEHMSSKDMLTILLGLQCT